MAGTYSYPDDVPEYIYRRHENCKCLVTYDPRDGSDRVQDVHSKKWKSNADDRMVGGQLLLENDTIYHSGKGIKLRDTYSNPDFKIKVLASHQKYAELGWQSTEHYNKQLLGRLNSGRIKSENKVIEILKKPVNYIDLETHRYVKYYDGIGIVIDDVNGALTTIVARKNPKERWVKKL